MPLAVVVDLDYVRAAPERLVRAGIGAAFCYHLRSVAYAPQTRPGRYTILEHLALDDDAVLKSVREYVGIFAG